MSITDFETNDPVGQAYIGEIVEVAVLQDDTLGSLIQFYIQNCRVKLQGYDVSYELVAGEDQNSCPDKFTEVDFVETTRVQPTKSSFNYRVFGFYGFDSTAQLLECTVKFCLSGQCPINIGTSC